MEKKITTPRGIEIEFLNIAPLLDNLRLGQIKSTPKAPTYTVPTALGATETHAHYQRFVEVPELGDDDKPTGKTVRKEETSLTTDAERAAWAEYEAALARSIALNAEKFVRTVMLYGIKYDKTAYENGAWAKRQEFAGLTIPTDPLEREWYWITTEILLDDPELFKEILKGVGAASGASEEGLSNLEALFRGEVGRTNGTAAAGLGDSNGRKGVVSVKPLRTNRRSSKKRHPAHK